MFDWDFFFLNIYLDINPQEGLFFLKFRVKYVTSCLRCWGTLAAHSLWLLIKWFMMRDLSSSQHVYWDPFSNSERFLTIKFNKTRTDDSLSLKVGLRVKPHSRAPLKKWMYDQWISFFTSSYLEQTQLLRPPRLWSVPHVVKNDFTCCCKICPPPASNDLIAQSVPGVEAAHAHQRQGDRIRPKSERFVGQQLQPSCS